MDGSEQGKQYMVPASIIVGAILISGSIIYAFGVSKSGSQGGSTNTGAGVTADALKEGSSRDVIIGDPNAPVTLIEYGDYQCPFCTRFFTDTEPLIREQYIKTGKVKMVFRNLMVNDRSANDHESHWSAEAAECAKDQGKFWDFHDALYNAEAKDEMQNPNAFENNGNLNRALFLSIASNLKLDTGKFTSCFDSHKYANAVQAESDGAQKLGATGTPTIFVNTQKIEGAYPFATFKQAIDAELAK